MKILLGVILLIYLTCSPVLGKTTIEGTTNQDGDWTVTIKVVL